MKTAVEFLVETLAENGVLHSSDISKAKAMEKEQLKNAYESRNWKVTGVDNVNGTITKEYIMFEQYYNETYGNEIL